MKELEEVMPDNNKLKKQQRKYFVYLLAGVIGVVCIICVVFNNNDKIVDEVKKEDKVITLGTDVVEGDKVWQEHFNSKLTEEVGIRKAEQDQSMLSITTKFEAMLKTQQEAMETLKEQLELYSQELQMLKSEPKSEVREEQNAYGVLQMMQDKEVKNDLPKDIGLYIPASTFVGGRLLSGISVSTGVSTQSSPMPIIIRLQDNAQLPNGFQTNMHDCRVVASCYGDLSSERAIVRLESLVCVNKHSKQSVETKVAGFVTGDDGVSGIRGVVVSMDAKHMKNAVIGSVLGGFGKAAKDTGNIAFNPTLGVISENQGFASNLKNNTLSGMGEGVHKIADYYIKKAESISPVIQIPSGTRIDVVFTEGVYFGQLNTKEIINNDRSSNNVTKDAKDETY